MFYPIDMQLYTEEYVSGKYIAYSSETEFLIQVGKGKSSYKTKHVIIGDLYHAIILYNLINIDKGFKKRLLMPSCSKNTVVIRNIK